MKSAHQQIDALVLAGGMGTRLRGAVPGQPKALAPIAGKPFLDWLIPELAGQGVRRIVFCTGYGADAIRMHVGDGAGHGVEAVYSHEHTPLGTAGAIRNALGEIRSDPFLVLNGDSWCRYQVDTFAAFHRESDAVCSVLLAEVPDPSRFGAVSFDERFRVTGFYEKHSGSGLGWINAGVYLLSMAAAEAIPRGRPVSLENEVFPALVGHGLYGWTGSTGFIDIGTPESFLEAQGIFAAKRGK